jgi:hypothetical protein
MLKVFDLTQNFATKLNSSEILEKRFLSKTNYLKSKQLTLCEFTLEFAVRLNVWVLFVLLSLQKK